MSRMSIEKKNYTRALEHRDGTFVPVIAEVIWKNGCKYAGEILADSSKMTEKEWEETKRKYP